MELKVATVLDALTNGTVDAESILLSFLHGLLPQRHCKASTSVVPGLLLMHVRIEGRLVEVDHRPVFHDPVRHSHSELDTLSFKLNWVFAVRIELGIRWCLLNAISKVEVSQFVPLNIDVVELLNLYYSLAKCEVHPVVETGAT